MRTTPALARCSASRSSAAPSAATLNINGGDSESFRNHEIVEKNKSISESGGILPAENPKKAGHTFLGWAKSPNATASDFDNNTTVNGDMKVYAVWKKNLNEVPLNASGNVYAKLDSAKNVNISAKNTSGDMKIEYFK